MANEVVIETELDAEPVTRSCEEIQKDIDRVAAAQERLQDRFDKFEFSGGDKSSRTFQNMRFDADKLNDKMILLTEEMERAKAANDGLGDDEKIEKVREACDRTARSVKNVGDSAKKSSKSFASGFKTMLKYAVGVQSIFSLINKMRTAVKEGMSNLVQFDGGKNSLNTAISGMVSSLTLMKNSLATAFSPIVTTVAPLVTHLVDLMAGAADTVGQFFAALSGSGTYTKAVKVQEDYAASLSNTGKNAKKAKGQLASFYDLNVINTKTDSGDSSAKDPSKMFETAQVESKIAGFAERVKAIIDPIRDSLAGWAMNIDVQPLIDSMGRLQTSLEPIVGSLGKGLKDLLDNVLEPIGSFAIEEAFPASIDAVSSAFNALTSFIEPVKPILSNLWEKVIKPFTKFLGEEFIKNIGGVKNAFSKLGDMFQSKSESIAKIFSYLSNLVTVYVTKFKMTLQFAGGFVREFLNACVNVIGSLIDVFAGFIDFITGVFTGDWEKAWNGIKDVFRGIVNLIIDIFEGAVNMIREGLNSISIDIPDFIPGVGGKHIGFNIPKANWPRLASGTVIPRQSKEFAAILGDNNREAEVVSPLSTMKQAFKEALAESGGGSVGNVTVVLQGDADKFFRVMQIKADEYLDRTGNPAFAF